MKIILSLKRRYYLARVIIFLLTVAVLIVWMTGCYICFPKQYELNISSTEGGSVTNPGERTFTYNAGTAVSLVATPDAGYCFVNWTGDVSTIDDVNAASTTITMNGNYAITANFALGIPVRDWYDLDAVRNNLSGHYVLMNDLDSATSGYTELASPTANGGKGWEPIGNWNWEQEVEELFEGTFNGQGYQIRGLYINRTDESVVGLFSIVGMGGVIKNIGVVNVSVAGNHTVGGLVGCNTGNMTNCYATGIVTGNFSVGGLAGLSCGPQLNCPGQGTLSNCYAMGSVAGNNFTGGLVGGNEGPVTNCYATSNVTGNGYVGGLVGVNFGNVTNCYSTGSVVGNNYTGGLVGENTIKDGPAPAPDGTVSNSFWDTQTSGQNVSAGGTGKNTTEMQDIDTFSGATWNITTVGGIGERNTGYIWNIVHSVTYPFLSWQP
jgi:hypothetical protein